MSPGGSPEIRHHRENVQDHHRRRFGSSRQLRNERTHLQRMAQEPRYFGKVKPDIQEGVFEERIHPLFCCHARLDRESPANNTSFKINIYLLHLLL